ncbi:SAF domain-containing protein [Paraoerskovia marina]|uniref:SAF domain-containing protein n=1 Tax=Paraoerskovia marina TaxID=545619 RepID=A0A1H1QE25_9CELL|nr:SAF domain-containing protein [Paraoerskovia marina]SDS21563.1 SAF domain-containing protein [Paraoerskovia marina]
MHSLRLTLWRLRFVVAAICAGLGVLVLAHALRPPPVPTTEVVVAVRDLAPGGVLTADDVELATRQASTVPPTHSAARTGWTRRSGGRPPSC